MQRAKNALGTFKICISAGSNKNCVNLKNPIKLLTHLSKVVDIVVLWPFGLSLGLSEMSFLQIKRCFSVCRAKFWKFNTKMIKRLMSSNKVPKSVIIKSFLISFSRKKGCFNPSASSGSDWDQKRFLRLSSRHRFCTRMRLYLLIDFELSNYTVGSLYKALSERLILAKIVRYIGFFLKKLRQKSKSI